MNTKPLPHRNQLLIFPRSRHLHRQRSQPNGRQQRSPPPASAAASPTPANDSLSLSSGSSSSKTSSSGSFCPQPTDRSFHPFAVSAPPDLSSLRPTGQLLPLSTVVPTETQPPDLPPEEERRQKNQTGRKRENRKRADLKKGRKNRNFACVFFLLLQVTVVVTAGEEGKGRRS